MTPTPFCCDITSGSVEERNEFKRLFNLASKRGFLFKALYYGIDKDGGFDCENNNWDNRLSKFTRIIPLTEGISILKEMVGEEEKPNEITFTEEDMIKCFKAGVDFARNVGNPSNSEYIMSVITSKIQPKP